MPLPIDMSLTQAQMVSNANSKYWNPYNTNAPQSRGSKILNDVLTQYPALQKVYNPYNTNVMMASPQRLEQLNKIGGSDRSMETWFPSDEGNQNFPHPNKGKWAFEYYNKDLYNNDDLLKHSLYLDALHGMKKDPTYASLRNDFNRNWKASELDWLKEKYKQKGEANSGESLGAYVDRTAMDAYIRGGLNEMPDNHLSSGAYNDEYAQLYRGKIKQNGKVIDPYSPQQRAIIDKMKAYLRKGK